MFIRCLAFSDFIHISTFRFGGNLSGCYKTPHTPFQEGSLLWELVTYCRSWLPSPKQDRFPSIADGGLQWTCCAGIYHNSVFKTQAAQRIAFLREGDHPIQRFHPVGALGSIESRLTHYCMSRLEELIQNGIVPFVVFDGADLPNKQETNAERKESIWA